jgi:RNA polymerase sigma factor (sigma-70 family)
MAKGQLRTVLSYIHRVAGESSAREKTDQQLLHEFSFRRDETAFAVLVQRHSSLVWGTCWRMLRHAQDAEDAFQATFLVLARKAGRVAWRKSVTSWLYAVAYRLASEVKTKNARRWRHERRAAMRTEEQSLMDEAGTDLCSFLDEELRLLPGRYREPLVLCYLEGQTGEQAARQLGWSLRTLQRRLQQGREKLRLRLAQRGLKLTSACLVTAVTKNAALARAPILLLESTVEAATLLGAGKPIADAVSSAVAALVQKVVRSMFWTKLKIGLAVVAAVGIIGPSVALLAGRSLGSGGEPEQSSVAQETTSGAELAGDDLRPGGGKGQVGLRGGDQAAKERAQTTNNLKHLALAMHNYYDAYGHFPPPAIYDGRDSPSAGLAGSESSGGAGGSAMGSGAGPSIGLGGSALKGGPSGAGDSTILPGPAGGAGGPPAMGMGTGGPTGGTIMAADQRSVEVRFRGKALLSWRVALLPFLGTAESELYRQFRLNESWDSPHNRQLLNRMPSIYAPAGAKPWATHFQVFVGPNAGFEKHRAMHMADIIDGTSNTIMIVKAGTAVPWSKPDDLVYDPDQPLPELSDDPTETLQAAFFDGSAHMLKRNRNEAMLRALITRNGGEAIDFVQVSAGGAERRKFLHTGDPDALREENEQLKQELMQIQRELDRFRVELEARAKTAQIDEEARKLMEENATLRDQIEDAREKMKAVAEQLQQLKQKQRAPKK